MTGTVRSDRFEERTGDSSLILRVDRKFSGLPGVRFALLKYHHRAEPGKELEEALFELVPVERGIHGQLDAGFELTRDASQELMDDLWGLGLRPTHIGDSGQVAAVQEAHLLDLRRILYHVLEVPGVTGKKES